MGRRAGVYGGGEVGWDGGGGGAGGEAAEGDAAYGVVADVALVVGVDGVLGGASPGGEGGEEGGPVVRGVYGEGGDAEGGGVVEGPAEGEDAAADGGGGEGGVEDGGDGFAVAGGGYFEGLGGEAVDADDFGDVEDGLPGAGGGAELGVGAGAAGGLDVDVLDLGAEVGEAPGDVVVVAYDDEGEAGEGDSGGVERPHLRLRLRSGAFEVGFVPEAGDGVGEVHVVGEEGLAGGGVGCRRLPSCWSRG